MSNFVVPHIGKKWYTLGYQLLDQQHEKILTGIRADHKSCEDSCMEMFEEWLNTDECASWSKLIKGLKAPGVKQSSLAKKLQSMLVKEPKPVCI